MTPLDSAPAPDWTRFAANLSSRLLNLAYEETDAGLEAVLGELAVRVGAHRALVLRVTPDDRVAVIATVPLTDNEQWLTMPRGSLWLFEAGAPVRHRLTVAGPDQTAAAAGA